MSQACCITASLLLLRNASTVVCYRRPSLDLVSEGELQSFSHVYVCAYACRQAHVYTRGHAWTFVRDRCRSKNWGNEIEFHFEHVFKQEIGFFI